jgi:DNA ligase D-like protein (predicted polymerase)
VPTPSVTLTVAGHEVTVTNPAKVYFPVPGHTKLELVRYYLAVSEAALRAVGGRPMALKRYPDGVEGEFFYQKRAPANRPGFVDVATFAFPSGRTAEEVVLRDAAGLAWVANLGCIDLHPHPVRADDLDHPDELRVDLDPVPGVPWSQVLDVALVVKAVLADHGLTGWPKTSGSRGLHVWARLDRRWTFDDVRRAALALAREVERRAPALATSKWWKEERHGVFVDYNQNARDRTTAAAWSVRATSDARVSMPLSWEDVPGCDPAAFTLATVPALLAARGDPHAEIDSAPGSLDGLLELARRDEENGVPDAPWPPHFARHEGEAPRAPPSRRRKPAASQEGGAPPGSASSSASPARRGTGRRTPSAPLLTVAKAARPVDALAGLERWKSRHPEVVPHLEPADVLVDSMRGRSTTWTRVRVNLAHVPEPERPAEEPPDPDYDPYAEGAPG